METHWKRVGFDEILPETRQMQNDILLAKQFLKASLPPPYSSPPGRLVGRWQAGDGVCQAPVSWLLGRGTSQGFLAAGPPGQPLSPGSALERAAASQSTL